MKEAPERAEAPGDSRVQRGAEAVILATLSKELGYGLEPRRVEIGDGIRVEIDGASFESNPPILVEAWAHQGRPRPGQKQKVMTDALKLVAVESIRYPGAQMILALADDDAAAWFCGHTWMAEALRHLRVEVRVVKLPEELRAAIREAQKRQER